MAVSPVDASAASTHNSQYFEILGNRAIYENGWIASCFHGRLPWIRLQGFEFDSWAAIVVPRSTPDAVANQINKAVYEAVQNPEVRTAFEATGNTVVNPTPVAELDRVYRAEVARYQAIAKSINFEPQ